MKQAETAAVVDFKAQVDRMADFLIAAGYDIKRTHLMEAGARFQGARDWRTLRTELSSKEKPIKKPKVAVPDLNGGSVRVYFEPHDCGSGGGAPQFCYTDITQSWVNKIFQLRAKCAGKDAVYSVDSEFDWVEWLDKGDIPRMTRVGIRVYDNEFAYFAQPKHWDNEIETPLVEIDGLIREVQAAIAAGISELYLFQQGSLADDVAALMDFLDRTPGDANYVDPDEYTHSIIL